MADRKGRSPNGTLSITMLAVTCLLAAVSVAKVARLFMISLRLEQAIKANTIVAAPTTEQVEKAIAASRTIADGLKKANIFIPAPAVRNPIDQVYAIMGDEVLINGRWYKAGDKVQDVNILAIEPTRVVIEWNSQRISLSPIQAAIEQEGGRPGTRGPRGTRGGPIGGTGPLMTQVGGPMAGPGGLFGFTEQDRQRIQNMSPEQRRNFFMQRLSEFGGMGGMRGGGFGPGGGSFGPGGRGQGGNLQGGGRGPGGGQGRRGGG